MVRSGLDLWLKRGFPEIKGQRIGVVCNHAAVDSDLIHLVDRLLQAGVKVERIFAPEHGFRGTLQDMAGVASSVDPQTNIPLVSLYGSTKESLAPKPEQLSGLDAVVCDLPDIGTRYYTFAQTIGLLMEVAAPLKLPILVLDRPNPLDGVTIEGAPLVRTCRSFCGYAPVPNRHGLSLGELCQIMNKGFGRTEDEKIPPFGADLKVITCGSWNRAQYFDQTGLPWVLPSPNMPTLDTALVYPGMCLFEATSLSEGRGTTRPFEFVGAPFIDGDRWSEATMKTGLSLKGAKLRPINFIPKFHKWSDQNCGGVQLHVTDRKTFKPMRWALALIAAAKKLYPEKFAWRGGSYEFEEKIPAIDLLYGNDNFRKAVEAGSDLGTIESEMSGFEARYAADRKPFLLY